MQLLSLLTYVLAFGAGAIMAAPAKGGDVTVTLKNDCSQALQVYQLTNGNGSPQESHTLSSGASYDFKLHSHWSGRFWGCEQGNTSSCDHYGSAVSLAEFLFKGFAGVDYYDISFVDGFNLPMKIDPVKGSGASCKSPTCARLPSCPKELRTASGACMSACEKFKTDEFCCTGAHNGDGKCHASSYAKIFKEGCPDAYSYAYDDATSTFGCKSNQYMVTFCPSS